ncbi:MAG: hypothetical protein FJ088_09670, partial [Deltaproteobacteria bacterium]|nr:hypothetical protein [Deltaproteobacteria bacterium]
MGVNFSRSLSTWKLSKAIFILVILASPSAFAKESVKINFLGDVDRTIKGVHVQHDYWFNLSPQWKFSEDSDLELKFSHSPILVKR